MSLNDLDSPLSSVFQQWASSSSSGIRPYRLLLQTRYSLQSRISISEPVENLHVYQRAGVLTPRDRATRDVYGGGEGGWLLRLVELAVKVQSDLSHGPDVASVIFITTKARPKNYSLIDELPLKLQQKVNVVDLASQNPFGWDSSDNSSGTNMSDLSQLYQRLQEEFGKRRDATQAVPVSAAPVIMIWQSLTPLIIAHGFSKVLRFLCALPTCFQVWSVNVQVLTPKQHAKLEDASNALLCMQDGQMTMIRQGIRERGNIIRKSLPFRLTLKPTPTSKRRYFLIELENDDCGNNVDDNYSYDGEKNAENGKEDTANKISRPSVSTRSRGVQLHLEGEEDAGSSIAKNKTTKINKQEATRSDRPRIYMQDNDPEFDDFDEEDPDDDLEI